jgi:hypothetical protein
MPRKHWRNSDEQFTRAAVLGALVPALFLARIE